ncbi:MAG: diadenylate cyclase CdaA [Bacteroidaceae bacterium]|nr:diadenylate cyclase CdaA [Bacteroidaceae bacterium]
MIDDLPFGVLDIIDVLCVTLLLYYVYRLMKDSGTRGIFYGIMLFVAVWIIVSQVLEMKLLGEIFDKLVSVGVLALIILFQDEIRRFFLTIGSQRKDSFLTRMFSIKKSKRRKSKGIQTVNPAVMQIVWACEQMSKKYVGALIVIERKMSLTDIIQSGESIDANINSALIQNIFFKNSPLHDGAMIISSNRILAAGCILPVSHNTNIPKLLGLRHRAALGITQQSDATAIVVSEETGSIALAHRGELNLRVSIEELESRLSKILGR